MALVTVIPGTFTTPGLPTLGIKGFTDTFTRPDANTLGSTEGMPSKPWATDGYGTNVTGIQDNEGFAYPESAGHMLATVDAEASDGTFNVTMGSAPAAATVGPAFRATDLGNFYRFVNFQGVNYRLHKFVDTSLTLLGAATVTPAPGDEIEIVLSGSSIRVSVNGVEHINVTDAHNEAATRHGFYNNVEGSTFRDVKFTAA